MKFWLKYDLWNKSVIIKLAYYIKSHFNGGSALQGSTENYNLVLGS